METLLLHYEKAPVVLIGKMICQLLKVKGLVMKMNDRQQTTTTTTKIVLLRN
jgi:hypothetical protein